MKIASAQGNVTSKGDSDLVGWLSDFLWHWEGSTVLHTVAARALIDALRFDLPAFRGEALRLPRPEVLLQALENRLYQK